MAYHLFHSMNFRSSHVVNLAARAQRFLTIAGLNQNDRGLVARFVEVLRACHKAAGGFDARVLIDVSRLSGSFPEVHTPEPGDLVIDVNGQFFVFGSEEAEEMVDPIKLRMKVLTLRAEKEAMAERLVAIDAEEKALILSLNALGFAIV